MTATTGEFAYSPVAPALAGAQGGGGDAYGAMIDGVRDDCGLVVGAIDWVLRKVGFDLIGAIMDPIAGDFNGVSDIRSGWANASGALTDISGNYAAMEAALPGVWLGDAAEACRADLTRVAEAYGRQGEAAALIATAIENMLDATETTVQLVAECLSFIDEIVISLTPAKVLKEIATGGGGIRKCISLAEKAIDYIRKLDKLIPALLQAVAAMSSVMKGINVALAFAEIGTQAGAGGMADDVAGSA